MEEENKETEGITTKEVEESKPEEEEEKND